jgi:hypothetical protein
LELFRQCGFFVFVFNFIHTSHFPLTQESELVFYSSCVLFFSDEKSKSNNESILRNWKTLKQYIELGALVRELERCNFLPKSSLENLGSKSRSHQATLVLITVYRKIRFYYSSFILMILVSNIFV